MQNFLPVYIHREGEREREKMKINAVCVLFFPCFVGAFYPGVPIQPVVIKYNKNRLVRIIMYAVIFMHDVGVFVCVNEEWGGCANLKKVSSNEMGSVVNPHW